MSSKTCKRCGEMGHTAFYCRQKPALSVKTAVKKPRKVKTPRQAAKENAWDAFSIYIRTRDCLRFTGEPDEGMCVTCKRWFPFKKLQAGHFIAGRGNAVLFDERIVYAQCWQCNGKPPYGLGGNYVEYFRFMLDEWGLEKIDEFRAMKNTDNPYKIHDFEETKRYYEDKTRKLLGK